MEFQRTRKLSVFNQNGGPKKVVCTYWLARRCKKNPCRFLHCEESKLAQSKLTPPIKAPPRKMTWKNPEPYTHETRTSDHEVTTASSTLGYNGSQAQPKRVSTELRSEPDKCSARKSQPQQCKYWVTGNCARGDECKYVHGLFSGSGFMMLGKLEGHTKVITGISLPYGSDKLYSCGKNESIRAWDCHTGQCTVFPSTDVEIGCLVAEGPWLLVGLKNVVKAQNLQKEAEFCVDGPAGLVCSLVTDDVGKLFAGTEDGSILVWKWHPETTSIPEPIAIMKEHVGAVCSLAVGAGNRLYSASKDCTIKMWDRKTLQCLHTLCGHTRDVTSVLCWGSYLLSASLDNSVKVWGLTEQGTFKVVYERNENSGIITMRGIQDGEDKPILLCSCEDNTVRLYDLPSFSERGRIFSRGEVGAIEIGIGGLFFTGDANGEIYVWKLLGNASS
ncbi:zinc finger CCCH domain-containing protein 48 [Phtheirospermum japonicum]|uniref:Zinc finger CCCH domain-containing protein 48 n=1 Tax=Phtheirospermum japonicum TaxID=374723 RepID=A0A830CJV7_9LAMI|nr:zinc finger CCCH domain-containing protein 48 [Phtheirospermum japonicum]